MGSSWWQCAACLRAQEEDICELQLNHCNLYDVPPDVFVYEMTLEKLYLDANRIRDLPRPLFQCHELRVLSLSDNEITSLPPAIASLINLEHLDLSKNSMKELPDSIKECKNLRSVDISVNPFERFPDAVTHIVALRELYINDAYIEYLPANFGRLSALRTLELRENNMMTLPKSMSRLINLERLDIGNNDFTELPEVVGDLTNLTELWIDGNDIRRIPGNIEQLYRLNHFDCTMNAVHSVPAEIQGWRDISIMNLSSNEIYQLPDSLCYLRTIVTLKIDDNQLNSLPVDIGQMSSLEELIVTKNFLEYLPSSIGLLRKLHCLNADNNYLRSLPPEIGSCTALSLLSLRSNNINSVPPELGHLSSLTVLNLVNNCIKFLPVSMLNLANLKALWLSDNQSQPLVPLQQEFNAEEDMMVLGCFMLPQKQRQQLEQMEQQAVGAISGSVVGTGRKICFAAEVESELPRQLHRAPTPYPKELRNLARHARNLHHQTAQSAHDQRTERETVIKEAVVAKATSITGTRSPQTKNTSKSEKSTENGNVAPIRETKPLVYNGETKEETNGTVIAKESSPEIREAKCVRNVTLESATRTPTIADYVNSTWKPEEYSKTNTAKIVESEKLAEPYKNGNASPNIPIAKISDRSSLPVCQTAPVCKTASKIGPTGKIVQPPPAAPPPYHIAAAFSKKAALFQRSNHDSSGQEDPSSMKKSNESSMKREAGVEAGVEAWRTIVTTEGGQDNERRNSMAGGEIYRDSKECPLETTASIVDNDGEYRSGRKPSRIPILRSKLCPEGAWMENADTPESYIFTEDYEKTRGPIDPSDVPTSPITGKKYRSPLSIGSARFSDRTAATKSGGNIFAGESPNDNARRDNSRVTSSASLVDGSTLASADLDSLDNTRFDDDSSNDASPERKTTGHKWMFGRHKNAYVLPVRVRKNPGLGFSIAGGIAGAETGIIVTKVNPEGPAQGTLRPGDKILEVDGIDFTKSDHNNAVAVLRSTGPVVAMLISRHQ